MTFTASVGVHVLGWQLYYTVLYPSCRCKDARGAVLLKGENIRLPIWHLRHVSSPHLRMVHRYIEVSPSCSL